MQKGIDEVNGDSVKELFQRIARRNLEQVGVHSELYLDQMNKGILWCTTIIRHLFRSQGSPVRCFQHETQGEFTCFEYSSTVDQKAKEQKSSECDSRQHIEIPD